jgi:hypothetical protein
VGYPDRTADISYAPGDLELGPVERVEHEVTYDVGILRQVQVIVDRGAARICYGITQHRSIEIRAAGHGDGGIRRIDDRCGLSASRDFDGPGSGVIDLKESRVQSHVRYAIAGQANRGSLTTAGNVDGHGPVQIGVWIRSNDDAGIGAGICDAIDVVDSRRQREYTMAAQTDISV